MPAPPLSPDHEKKPVPCMPMSAMPQGGIAHRVQDGDNWGSIAQKYGFSDPWVVIYYNFQTRDPREVNWYLREYVGCNVKTPDGKNWRFSTSAYPGIIYIPRENPNASLLRFDKVWLGGGIRGSFRILNHSKSKCMMVLYNVESLFAPGDSIDACYLEAEFTTTGFDLEYGGEMIAVAAVGFSSALSFKGYSQSDLRLGGGAGFQELGGFGMKELVTALRSGPPADQTALRERFKRAFTSMGVNREGSRRMYIRTDGKLLIDLKKSAEKIEVLGLSGLKIKRASVKGPTVQSSS